MNSRGHLQPFLNNSLAIRQEIQRFESVHPSIYAIYDLIELIPDAAIAQQIRDHVVCIEDSFVNSQEWTLSRSVPDLRLGIVGSLSSGKSALVHRYLTGSYMQEESPEGGRFKKEILVDNQSYLLLIRDEGGPPELQFTAWVDAVIFVFSLENEASFNAIYNYYTKMAHYRNSAEIPLILVGTQDAISENHPRVIDDSRARKLASDLKRCSYYETCATYGLNVERVFQDACQKIVQHRLSTSATCLTPTNSRPSTPSGGQTRHHTITTPQHHQHQQTPNGAFTASPTHHHHHLPHQPQKEQPIIHKHPLSSSTTHLNHKSLDKPDSLHSSIQTLHPLENNNISSKYFVDLSSPQQQIYHHHQQQSNKYYVDLPTPQQQKDLPTPSSTPTTVRKTRRRSNLFTASKKTGDERGKNGEMGSGRAIPLKQGYLYKRSNKGLNKDWKKKYVTLCDDGRLTYHPSLHDYMEDVHGKEISLQYVTVKVPGQKPRGSKSIITVANSNSCSSATIHESLGGLSITSGFSLKDKQQRLTDKVLLTAFDVFKDPSSSCSSTQQNISGDESSNVGNNAHASFLVNGVDVQTTAMTTKETPNVKKRHRRMKSSGVKNSEFDDADMYEFFIVSLDNKQWHFEASNSEDRDEWVAAIEQQILNSLQANETSKTKAKIINPLEASSIQIIRAKNDTCVDCGAPNPDWASINLGVLMCIECSGIHRNLGSHISRIRSLDLDEWPPGHLSVMLAIGNSLANSVWESQTPAHLQKPQPNSSRELKEQWIRSKYETKEFLPPLNLQTSQLQQQQSQKQSPSSSVQQVQQFLLEAICRNEMRSIILVLAHANSSATFARFNNDLVNCFVSASDRRTPLHLACAMGNLAVAQLLIWNNANIHLVDQDGRNCLTYAKASLSVLLAKVQQSDISSSNNSTDLATATANCKNLVDLLLSNGCADTLSNNSTGTMSRKKPATHNHTNNSSFDKLPSSVI